MTAAQRDLADRDLVICCVPQDQAMAAADRCAGAIALFDRHLDPPAKGTA